MPETDIDSAVASDISNAIKDFSISPETTEGVDEVGETRWEPTNRAKYLGYFRKVGILKRVINAKATWTVGKGFKADEETTLLLDSIKGIGNETFNSIIETMIRDMQIGGDAYCHIIRDDEENLINLKVLDPDTMVHIADNSGTIIRYEQKSKIKGKKNETFDPEEIFHLMRNKIADEIHGDSLTEALETTILMREEARNDWKRVMHHNIDPMIAYKLDTDDTTKIANFKTAVDNAKGKGENMYIPKDTVEFEVISLAPNANLNPLPWIASLDDDFHKESGVPAIITGGSGAITEAAVKIAYLAFEQTIEEDQLYIEEQILSQLNLVIELEFPASLENELLSDKGKDEEQGAVQENDTTAGSGE